VEECDVTTHYSLQTQEGRINIRLDSLPPAARRKFQALKALVEDTAALTRVAMGREKAIEDALYDAQRRRSYVDPQVEPERATHLSAEVEELQAELQRLNSDRMKRESVRANTEQILSQIKFNFLAAEDFAFPQVRAYTGPPAHPRDGESLADAIVLVRRDITRAQGELVRVKQAPPSVEEAKAAVIAEIRRLASVGKPQLRIADGGKISIWFPDQQLHAAPGSALVAPSGSASAMLCWLFTEQIIENATANLHQMEGGISASDRKRKIAELTEQLSQLETDEESLITQALDAGMEAHRRVHASGFALLGLEVVATVVATAPEPTPIRRRMTNGGGEDAAQAAE
jgi:hypothetical protein